MSLWGGNDVLIGNGDVHVSVRDVPMGGKGVLMGSRDVLVGIRDVPMGR